MARFKIGDEVIYSNAFIAKLNPYAGDCANDRGVVTEVQDMSSGKQYIKVQWDIAGVKGALSSNLAHYRGVA